MLCGGSDNWYSDSPMRLCRNSHNLGNNEAISDCMELEHKCAICQIRHKFWRLWRLFQLHSTVSVADVWKLEQRVTKNEEDFKEISETIRKELARFDRQKARDFKSTVVNYLQCMMNYQQQVNSHMWRYGIDNDNSYADCTIHNVVICDFFNTACNLELVINNWLTITDQCRYVHSVPCLLITSFGSCIHSSAKDSISGLVA